MCIVYDLVKPLFKKYSQNEFIIQSCFVFVLFKNNDHIVNCTWCTCLPNYCLLFGLAYLYDDLLSGVEPFALHKSVTRVYEKKLKIIDNK